ncbi:MAG TPA: hypothetical protein VMF67_12805 [Rhizomicrobium sp.]|nr:hypothetical protein [Rhizomicrobium sp.]
MPFRTNYRQERAQRTRVREAKQQEKLARREEASVKRKALRESEAAADHESGTPVANEAAKPQDE